MSVRKTLLLLMLLILVVPSVVPMALNRPEVPATRKRMAGW